MILFVMQVTAETLSLLKARDAKFLERLFREVNPYLTRIAISNGFSTDEAGELVHQAWEQFFANLDKFEGRSQVGTFLAGILINKIREQRRLQKRFIAEDDGASLDQSFTPDGWWKSPPPAPDRLIEARQSAAFVQECLEDLSEQQRTAFVLREVNEDEAESICETLGVSAANLRVLLFRAKDKLKKCIEGKLAVKRGPA